MSPSKVQRSRTFVVIRQTEDDCLNIHVMHKKTVIMRDAVSAQEKHLPNLIVEETKIKAELNQLMDLLVKIGVTVRTYDHAEKQWMDHSITYGIIRAPGLRDGTWGRPSSLEEFEEQYLNTV